MPLDGFNIRKSDLEKRKNDDEVGAGWVPAGRLAGWRPGWPAGWRAAAARDPRRSADGA